MTSPRGRELSRLEQLLTGLTPARRRHSVEVARKAAEAGARVVDPAHLPDLVTAALLHDIGYQDRYAEIDFHPLDGAAALRRLGFTDLVCHLVAHHTGSHLEAAERDIPPTAFAPYQVVRDGDPDNLALDTLRVRSVLAWADLCTEADGSTCTVEERLDGILGRYSSDSPVFAYVTRHRNALLAMGRDPLGLESTAAAAAAALPQAGS